MFSAQCILLLLKGVCVCVCVCVCGCVCVCSKTVSQLHQQFLETAVMSAGALFTPKNNFV